MKTALDRVSLLGFVPAVLLLASGCGGPTASDSSEQAGAARGYDSPQAVTAAARTALEAQNYKGFCDCLTPESHDTMAGGMIMAGAMMKAFSSMGSGLGALAGGADPEAEEKMKQMQAAVPKLDQVFQKHGLAQETLSDLNPMQNPDEMEQRMAQLAGPIADKPQFVADMLAVFESMGQDQPGSPAQMLSGELRDVNIAGNEASATLLINRGGSQQEQPIEFKKVDGSWLIHLPAETQ